MTASRVAFSLAARWAVVVASVLAGVSAAGGLEAQQRPALPAVGQPTLETVRVRPNVYVIFGAGANITVHVGEDGVILVDSGNAASADAVIDAVRAITPQKIRMIINTSADADHVGGNEKVAQTGVSINPDVFTDQVQATIIAHENVADRMSEAGSPFPGGAWPTETFTSRYRSMYINDDAVRILRHTGAHSDGDSMVLFRRADVIVAGDVLDLRHFPDINPAKGGSIQGELAALNELIDLAVPNMPLILKEGRTFIVPGHGRISDYAEVVEYRDMVTVIRNIIQDLIDKGRTLEQVKAANPTAGYRARYGTDSGPWTTDMFVEAIYNGLKAQKGKS